MGDYKFRAFISYSHADEEWGAWLQRSLERFRAPRDLAKLIAAGGRPVRLAPVFRDREDLPVAGNLNEAIQKALADSEFQIVLCSPNAAKSRWVNEEIKLFNRLHGPGRTFAIIIGGEPGDRDRECFPPALRFRLGPDGEPTTEPHEPLAADAREEGDGKRYAILKTAAGMLGVGLDDLVRREAKARAERTRAIAGVTSLIAAFMTFAAVFAFNQRNEARAARGEAEDLIEFMLSDLADRLEPVNSLAILDEVGGKVLAYYDDQNLKSLDAEALSRRARGLLQLGNVDQRRGDLDAALSAYEAAFASTEEQLRRAPNDPDRIFDHAQSVFYVGNIAAERGDLEKGESAFQTYHQLAKKLVGFDGANPKWRLELAYALSNLGSLHYRRGDYEEALRYFHESAELRGELAKAAPGDRKFAFAHAYALSWQAYAELAAGDYRAAIETLTRQLSIYDSYDADHSGLDYASLENRITAERRLAEAHLALGDLTSASNALEQAETIGDLLLARDPENLNSLTNVGITARQRSAVFGFAGDKAAEIAAARRALGIMRQVLQREPSSLTSRFNFGAGLVRMISADPINSTQEARELAALLEALPAPDKGEHLDFFGSATLALATYAHAAGTSPAPDDRVSEAIARLRGNSSRLTVASQEILARLLAEAGDREAAGAIVQDLYAQGIRKPDLMALREKLAFVPEL